MRLKLSLKLSLKSRLKSSLKLSLKLSLELSLMLSLMLGLQTRVIPFSISNDKSSPCMILMTWVHVCVACAVCLCRTLVD